MVREIDDESPEEIPESITDLVGRGIDNHPRDDEIVAGIALLSGQLQNKFVSRHYHDQIIQSISEMLFTLAPNRTIKNVNRSAQVLLGYAQEELVGAVIDELVVEQAMSPGQQIRRKDGTLVPVVASESNILDERGNLLEIACVVRDLTDIRAVEGDLKRISQQLFQAAKLTALGELAAGVTHELNQPLNAVNIVLGGLLREIDRGCLDEASLRKQLLAVGDQVTRMAELINHMRTFARTTDGRKDEMLDLSALCDSALKFFRPHCDTHGIEVITTLAPSLPPVLGNSIRLEQVLVNLFANARYAVEEAGGTNKRIRVSTFGGEREVNVEVADSGTGVPNRLMQRIFEPFFTTKPPGDGTGLGLSIARKIIEDHRGTLTLINRVGDGATFRIALPAEQTEAKTR